MTTHFTLPSIASNPTLRTPCLNTVAVVPLLSPSPTPTPSPPPSPTHTAPTNTPVRVTKPTHSEESFRTFFSCLSTFANSSTQTGTTRLPPSDDRTSDDVTLIVPNSQMTRPGDWRYDSTPLNDHDWLDGYQRMVVFDGRCSVLAHERLESSTSSLPGECVEEYRRRNEARNKAADAAGTVVDGGGGDGGTAATTTTTSPFSPTAIQQQQQQQPTINTTTTTTNTHRRMSVKKTKRKKSHYGDFIDLYPHRGISAVIGVLNIRDCKSVDDLLRAERELDTWKARFTPRVYCDRKFPNTNNNNTTTTTTTTTNNNNNDAASSAPDPGGANPSNPMDPSRFVIQRLFVFDSFEEGLSQQIDLGRTKAMEAGELVAFPPIESMEVHINLVVNDLAVAMFMALERRIRVLNQIVRFAEESPGKVGVSSLSHHTRTVTNNVTSSGKTIVTYKSTKNKNKPNSIAASTNATPLLSSSSSSSVSTTTSTNTTASSTTVSTNTTSTTSNKGPIRGLRSIAGSALKALNSKAQQHLSSLHTTTSSSNPHATNAHTLYYLSTPLDTIVSPPNLTTTKSIGYRIKRNAARIEKYCADLALLAGSPLDAYRRYMKAAELTKDLHDPLWYAASLEGIATCFVAMSDTGGHGADSYLEKSFQYPEEVTVAAVTEGKEEWGIFDEGFGGAAGFEAVGKIEQRYDRNKTTMPSAVLTYLEEAIDIMSRHVVLSSVSSELLLKVAWYITELEGMHMRCRWGEGFFSIDDTTNRAKQAERKWESTNVTKSELRSLEERGLLTPAFSVATVSQCQRVTDLLHRSVSNSALDANTRAFVAARCATMCLKGVQIPTWSKDTNMVAMRPFSIRFPLPRKAAFFMVIAADSMAQCTAIVDAQKRAVRFWDAASILYSREGNRFDCNRTYGWATLRAGILHALSLQSDCHAAELVMKQLLTLLAEISPESAATLTENCTLDVSTHTNSNLIETMQQDVQKTYVDSSVPPTRNTSSKNDSGGGGNGNNQRNDLVQRKGIPARSSFFVHLASPQFSNNSKWLEDDPVPMLELPFIESPTIIDGNLPTSTTALEKSIPQRVHSPKKLASFLIALNCVVPKMNFEDCAAAQRYCIAHLSSLRHTIATSSFDGCQYLEGTQRKEPVPYLPPLEIVSAAIIKSESHLLLDRTKAAGFTTSENESMRTFFNPYDTRAKDESLGKNLITVVAEGEERTIEIEFCNRLSIAIEIPSCQLEFDKSRTTEIEAPPLSFTVPPNQDRFVVHFPFIVVDSKNRRLGGAMKSTSIYSNNSTSSKTSTLSLPDNSFEVIGVRVSCFNRNILIPFERSDVNDITINKSSKVTTKTTKTGVKNSKKPLQTQMPAPVSVYTKDSTKKVSDRPSVRLEAVPAQPNLLVSFSTSPTSLEDATLVPVHLSDGEIYTIPPFRLENDFGPSGSGRMERLQIVGVGLPGLPDEILFDTDEMAKALEEKEGAFSETDSDDESTAFEDLMEADGLPPLKMKCIAGSLSLKSINDMSNSFGEGSLVTFQIAATHDMGNQLANGGHVRIRFRYRGLSSCPGIEIWRKREVHLQIIRVKGPRLSSLTLRSDLSWGSAYADLCRSLAHQLSQLQVVRNWDSSRHLVIDPCSIATDPNFPIEKHPHSLLQHVGINHGVFVSGDNIVVLMAVANETNSTIILSNRIGMVGGFESSPMPTVRVTSGISVKIPVVIPRIDFLDENGEISDVATELIARTALQWESEVDKVEDSVNTRVRQGRVRIPSRCLREIFEEHKSFATRICKPPVTIDILVGKGDGSSEVVIYPGHSVDTAVKASIQDWVPASVLTGCSITLEFCCARKNSGRNSSTFKEENSEAYFWCGQVRKTVGKQKTMDHRARICFLKPGVFVVSACVKIHGRNSSAEETWWAPRAKSITVERVNE